VTGEAPSVLIRVIGPLRLICSSGQDCTPAGRKTRALLALLVLSPERRRTRNWIQDRLWGTRGKEQAAGSLRQALMEVRKALDSDRDALMSDHAMVWLDASRVRVDLDALPARLLPSEREGDLLEGLSISHEDFDKWLGEQRQAYEARFAAVPGAPALATPVARSGALGAQPKRSGSIIVLSRGARDAVPHVDAIADELLDNISKTVTELGLAHIVDHRLATPDVSPPVSLQEQAPVLLLRSHVLGTHQDARCRLTLISQPDNELIWSGQFSAISGAPLNDIRLIRQANEAAAISLDRLAREQPDDHAPSRATALCNAGVHLLFKLGKENFARADELFANAYDLHPRGLYLAWRSYLRTFLLAEATGFCRKTLDEEAFALLRKAFELEPNNSYVIALGAHVHSMIRRSYMSAYELAERSIDINPANPIGWALLGIAKCYLGNSEEGFQNTLAARSISGYAPYRYQIDALSCIAGTMAGQFDQAVHLGESSHFLAPEFAAPMRYLAALYSHKGEHDRAFDISETLRKVEPDFSYRKMKDREYPAAGLRRTGILENLPSE